jgi:hypothetical protein
MIIVEGGDNVGKTTLIQQLLEMDPSLRVLHRDRFKPQAGETIGRSYLKALTPSGDDRVATANSIADRFMASEVIYGDLFRNGNRLTLQDEWTLRLLLQSYGTLIVHCDPGDAVIKKDWASRPQLYPHDPLLIARTYRADLPSIFRGFTQMQYDWTHKNADQARLGIIAVHQQMMKAASFEHAWWSALPYGVGKLQSPRVVLIGEGLSPRAWTTVPFAHGPAGAFLAEACKHVEQQYFARRAYGLHNAVYVTNAEKGSDRDVALLRAELRLLDPQPGSVVVALGRVAERMLNYVERPQQVDFVSIEHPQYWRRFHADQPFAYFKKFFTLIHKALP